MIHLDEKSLGIITNALYTACERYRECASTIKACPSMNDAAKAQLVDQFELQIREAREVLQAIENSEG